MRSHIIIPVLCAAGLILSACGKTGDEPAPAASGETTTTAAATTTTAAETTAAAAETSKAAETSAAAFTEGAKTDSAAETAAEETKPADDRPTTPDITAEQAQKIADEGMACVHENDALGIVQKTTYGTIMRCSNDEDVPDKSDEGLAKWLSDFWEKDSLYHDMRACYPFQLYVTHSGEPDDYFGYACKNPAPMTENEVAAFNMIMDYMAQATAEDGESIQVFPSIVDGYSFDIVYDSGRESPPYKAYVLKTEDSGEYKLDLFYTQYANAAKGFIALTEMGKAEDSAAVDNEDQ